MTTGATYSPGAWFALVSPTVAILVDPALPGQQLDLLWRAVEAGVNTSEALEIITAQADTDAELVGFALAGVEGDQARVVMRGAVQVTVQDQMGGERVLRGVASMQIWEEYLDPSDLVWLVRPGGQVHGVALPIQRGAVMADVLAWQPNNGSAGLTPSARLSGSDSARRRSAPHPEPLQRRLIDQPSVDQRPVVEQPQVAHVGPAAAPARAASGGIHVGVPGRRATSGNVLDRGVSPDEVAPPRPVGRRGPGSRSEGVGRRVRGLGSYARRRYGADDWSLPQSPVSDADSSPEPSSPEAWFEDTSGTEQSNGNYGASGTEYHEDLESNGYHETLEANGYHETLEANGYHETLEANGYHETLEANGYHEAPEANGYHEAPEANGYHHEYSAPELAPAQEQPLGSALIEADSDVEPQPWQDEEFGEYDDPEPIGQSYAGQPAVEQYQEAELAVGPNELEGELELETELELEDELEPEQEALAAAEIDPTPIGRSRQQVDSGFSDQVADFEISRPEPVSPPSKPASQVTREVLPTVLKQASSPNLPLVPAMPTAVVPAASIETTAVPLPSISEETAGSARPASWMEEVDSVPSPVGRMASPPPAPEALERSASGLPIRPVGAGLAGMGLPAAGQTSTAESGSTAEKSAGSAKGSLGPVGKGPTKPPSNGAVRPIPGVPVNSIFEPNPGANDAAEELWFEMTAERRAVQPEPISEEPAPEATSVTQPEPEPAAPPAMTRREALSMEAARNSGARAKNRSRSTAQPPAGSVSGPPNQATAHTEPLRAPTAPAAETSSRTASAPSASPEATSPGAGLQRSPGQSAWPYGDGSLRSLAQGSVDQEHPYEVEPVQETYESQVDDEQLDWDAPDADDPLSEHLQPTTHPTLEPPRPHRGSSGAPCFGSLVMQDGQGVEVDGPVIIGRAPSIVDGDRAARLVPVRGLGRGISRNHVRVDTGVQGPFVVDLGSRNGTRLHRPGMPAVALEPWMPYPMELGSVLMVADVMLSFVACDEAELDDHDESADY